MINNQWYAVLSSKDVKKDILTGGSISKRIWYSSVMKTARDAVWQISVRIVGYPFGESV